MTDKSNIDPALASTVTDPETVPHLTATEVNRSRLAFNDPTSIMPSFLDGNKDGLRPLLRKILGEDPVLDGSSTLKLTYEDFEKVLVFPNTDIRWDADSSFETLTGHERVCNILLDGGQVGSICVYAQQWGFVVAMNSTKEQYEAAKAYQE